MFHDGDLQSGIALALTEAKLVACFVTDGSEQSNLWENDFLRDGEISAELSTKAVLLRITADSKEAGYLSAYYPVPAVPALLILHNGRVLLCLGAGLEKSQVKRSILQTLDKLLSPSETSERDASHDMGESVTNSGTTLAESEYDRPPNMDESVVNQPTTNPQALPSAQVPRSSSVTPATPSPVSNRIQDMLAERSQRLDKDKKDKEAIENAERKAKIKARHDALAAEPGSAKAKQANYAQQQRKRTQDAKAERERILREIENNKAERKEKEELRKAAAKAEAEGRDGAGGLVDQQLEREVLQSQSKNSDNCAVQVRLFDGSTIRRKFPVNSSLGTHVRLWISEKGSESDTPYTIKQILTPMPNRTFSASEEEESLQSLGLTPSATLVMVPVPGHFTAYPDQSILSRGVSMIHQLYNLIFNLIRTMFGMAQTGAMESQARSATAPDSGSNEPRVTVDSGARINVRTLRDQREERGDDQFYNGNQLNFEPNKDKDDKKD